MAVSLYCLLVLFISALVLVISSVRLPSEDTRLVVFRLGRFIGVRDPGLVFLMPIIDKAIAVDMREQERKLSWEGITPDRSQVFINLQWRYQVFNPSKCVLSIGNVEAAMESIIGTSLRRVILDMHEADLRMNRRSIEMEVEAEVREKTRNFGVKLQSVEILEMRIG